MLPWGLEDVLATRSTHLALELMSRGADIVVVGSTATWLLGGRRWPRDLDVVVTDQALPRLTTALTQVGARDVSVTRLRRAREVAVSTPWGPVDVFVAADPPRATRLLVEGDLLAVAG